MASKTDICNMALGHFGEDVIADISEESEPARACKLHYDNTRKTFLRDFAFAFATKRASLNDTGEAVTGWTYRYALPNDCIKPIEVVTSATAVEFVVEGEYLLTDAANATLKYTANITDTTRFDEDFVSAFSYALAARLCVKLTGDKALAQDLYSIAVQQARRVRATSLNAQFIEPAPPETYSAFLKARS